MSNLLKNTKDENNNDKKKFLLKIATTNNESSSSTIRSTIDDDDKPMTNASNTVDTDNAYTMSLNKLNSISKGFSYFYNMLVPDNILGVPVDEIKKDLNESKSQLSSM